MNNGIISSKIYDKRDDFDSDMVNYPHLDGDVPRATSYGVYISQLIRFARTCSSVEDFHIRNRTITKKTFLNRVTDLINFGKYSRSSIIEMFLSLASINAT